ncbi:hypothetical protein LCGC14_0721430 [marine sediment metagenome]|uniref:Uncharacterized protein n=1 Tax=marine sediment metagenome TaxID=412755 RepID=A0A0F9QC93_9ZZZZ
MAGDGFKVEAVNLAEVQQYLDDLPEDTFDDAKLVFQTAVLEAHKTVSKNLKSKLNSRTGTLARSIRTEVKGTTLRTLRAALFGARDVGGKELVYTLVQEFGTGGLPGGVIRAKNAYKGVPGGPYLNIPVGVNLTPAGVQRLSAREVFSQQGAHIRGRAVFVGDKMMFALVKQVKIKPRLGMRDAVDAEIPTVLSSLQDLIGE